MSNENLLKWFGDYGTLPAPPGNAAYDDAYFDKYVGYSQSELGYRLNRARLDLVADYVRQDTLVVDIGIGCGQFVASRPNTLGFDVNPKGVQWLTERNFFINPYLTYSPVMTFWDSFEHIYEPRLLLDQCTQYAIMSIPIFKDKAHVLRSKHFRPDEHFFYFTELGLLNYMSREGFEMTTVSDMETKLGREDIKSFVFRRLRKVR